MTRKLPASLEVRGGSGQALDWFTGTSHRPHGNPPMTLRATGLVLSYLGLAVTAPLRAQAAGRIDISPAALTLDVAGTGRLKAVVFDSAGRPIDVPVTFFSTNRRAVEVDSAGLVRANRAGEYIVVATAGSRAGIRAEAMITVRLPALATIALLG